MDAFTREGVDYAFPPIPRASVLAQLGKTFACRYGGPGSGKFPTAEEVAALTAAGLSIVANAEGDAGGLLRGYDTGRAWARSADAFFRKLGMPSGRPIYFSADVDLTAQQWPAVREALRGAADELGGVHRVGIYGEYDAMVWARRDQAATWFWQTYAWSGSPTKWAPGNNLEQYRNGVEIDGADCDLDRALTSDFGQWNPGRGPGMEQTDKLLADTGNTGRTVANVLGDAQNMRNLWWGEGLPAAAVPPRPGAPILRVMALPDDVAALKKSVDQIKAGGVDHDQLATALAALLVPGLVEALAPLLLPQLIAAVRAAAPSYTLTPVEVG